MAISMQGAWAVRVKSKSAAFPQRFVVAGATSGNGAHPGNPGTEIHVTGSHWSVQVQHDPGSGWQNSAEQIKFPVAVGAEYRFDIESNDSGPDKDFNDLILTCAMPATATDFLIYGNVKAYSGRCFPNPCHKRPWVVVDDVLSIKDLLERPVFREVIEVLYPEWIKRFPPNPPDPPPFRPLVLPMGTQQALPPKTVQILPVRKMEATGKAAKAEAGEATETVSLRGARIATVAEAVENPRLSANRHVAEAALGSLASLCWTETLSDFVVRFQEYDRTAAELAGGPYTGGGDRHNLGSALTDRNGNYVFRFSLSLADIVTEVLTDVAAGENAIVQAMPDLIAQVLDPTIPSGVIYESAPFFNVPVLKRIDICLPKRLVPVPPPCVGGQIIQSVGNVNLGPLVAGQRTTSNTFLGIGGRITSRSSIGPQVNCAAWGGTLYLYACLSNADIKFYTVRYKRPAGATWNAVTQEHTQYRRLALPPWEVEESVKVSQNLEVDGSFQVVTAYKNVETDPPGVWKERWLQLKMKLASYLYELALGGPGTIQFRIEGYRADGTKVAGADDTVNLYVDNYADYASSIYIDPNVSMIPSIGPAVTMGNCALFTLPAGEFNAPLRVTFRANQLRGFMNEFRVLMEKGAIGGYAIEATPATRLLDPPDYISSSYVHGDDLICTSFRGTIDDARYDAVNNLLSVDVVPDGGADWLTGAETFCAFRIYIRVMVRITDGQYVFSPYYTSSVLIGIKKP